MIQMLLPRVFGKLAPSNNWNYFPHAGDALPLGSVSLYTTPCQLFTLV